jgi:hypothetical protein
MVVDGEHFLEIGVGVGVILVVVMNDDAREKAFGGEREREDLDPEMHPTVEIFLTM